MALEQKLKMERKNMFDGQKLQKKKVLCWKKISVARHKQMKKLEAAQLGKAS